MAEPNLHELFHTFDKDNSGFIDIVELQQALITGPWPKPEFPIETCKMMIGIFDREGTFRLNFESFSTLWRSIKEWKAKFDAADHDKSLSIDPFEMKKALQSFGYQISEGFIMRLIKLFDRIGKNEIEFNDFVHLCATLECMMHGFRVLNPDSDGKATINFENYLHSTFSVIKPSNIGQGFRKPIR